MLKFTMPAAIVVASLAALPALAKDLQFWNATQHEFTEVYLAPAGTTTWGKNQTLNDPDKAVSADERLAIKGVSAGHYDVKLVDSKHRTCIVPNVEVKTTGKVAFTIAEDQLTDCKQ
jgi:hypothetical protein